MYERISHERSCNYGKTFINQLFNKKMENLNASPKLTFGEAVKACFKKYATFKGRARRSEYWWFWVVTMIPSCLLSALANWKMGVATSLQAQAYEAAFDQAKYDALMKQAESCDAIFFPCAIILGIVMLALLLPSLAVAVRRLHDVGKSGKIILLGLIPFVNFVIAILLFVWALKDSDPKENQYGPSPKYSAEA